VPALITSNSRPSSKKLIKLTDKAVDEIKKPKKSKKHIADVQEPGTTAPTPTSRPVIVTNRPLLQDPIVVEQADEAVAKPADDQPAAALPSNQKVAIQPLEAVDAEKQDGAGDEEPLLPETESVAEADEAEDIAETPESRPAAPDQSPESAPASLNQADQPALANPTPDDGGEQEPGGTPKQTLAKQAEAEAAAQAKHDAEVQEMIDSKRYVLPINAVEKRKSKRFVVLGVLLAVILIIIWLDIALDAGIIKLGGLEPLTHFFSN
jgi:hypothetical protein